MAKFLSKLSKSVNFSLIFWKILWRTRAPSPGTPTRRRPYKPLVDLASRPKKIPAGAKDFYPELLKNLVKITIFFKNLLSVDNFHW